MKFSKQLSIRSSNLKKLTKRFSSQTWICFIPVFFLFGDVSASIIPYDYMIIWFQYSFLQVFDFHHHITLFLNKHSFWWTPQKCHSVHLDICHSYVFVAWLYFELRLHNPFSLSTTALHSRQMYVVSSNWSPS